MLHSMLLWHALPVLKACLAELSFACVAFNVQANWLNCVSHTGCTPLIHNIATYKCTFATITLSKSPADVVFTLQHVL